MKKIILSIFTSIVIFNTNLFAVVAFPATSKGFRPEQEDITAVYSRPHSLYCGIFDGHGGVDVAIDLREILLKRMVNVGCFEDNGMDEQQISQTITSYFKLVNSIILRRPYKGCPGSTALISFVLNNNKLVVANAGDSRAVLCKSGKAIKITTDHKASDLSEAQRVLSLGGFMLGNRVFGMLAVSRAFGDHMFITDKVALKSCIEPQPDVFISPIQPEDDFLIMASDGLWDTVENEEAIRIVNMSGGPSKKACQDLIEAALARGSADNISVIIIDLKN